MCIQSENAQVERQVRKISLLIFPTDKNTSLTVVRGSAVQTPEDGTRSNLGVRDAAGKPNAGNRRKELDVVDRRSSLQLNDIKRT